MTHILDSGGKIKTITGIGNDNLLTSKLAIGYNTTDLSRAAPSYGGPDKRAHITLSQKWFAGIIQFSCSIRNTSAGTTGNVALQYYNESTWELLNDTILTHTGDTAYTRKYSPALILPSGINEYRVAISSVGPGTTYAMEPYILVTSSGYDVT